MTTSQLADPNVPEWRYPVRQEGYKIEADFGGRSLRQGGDGSSRKISFLEKFTAPILLNNRLAPPFGAAGGEPGACGRNYVLRVEGRQEDLSFVMSRVMHPGDVFVIETPGGGGCGKPVAEGPATISNPVVDGLASAHA